MSAYSLFHAGALAELSQYTFGAGTHLETQGKVFLKAPLKMTGLEISLNEFKPLQATPFLHCHRENEEVYLVLRGEGQFQIDNEVVEIREGSAVRVDKAAARGLRNTSETERLLFLVIQAPEGGLEEGETADGYLATQCPAWRVSSEQ